MLYGSDYCSSSDSYRIADPECDVVDRDVLCVRGPKVKDKCDGNAEIARPKRKLLNLSECDDDTSEGTRCKDTFVRRHQDITFFTSLQRKSHHGAKIGIIKPKD